MSTDLALPIVLAASAGVGLTLFLLLRVMTGGASPQFRKRLARVQGARADKTDASQRPASLRRSSVDGPLPRLDAIIGRFLPRPAMLRRRLARTGRRISIAEYAVASSVTGLVTVLLFIAVFGFPPLMSLLFGIAAGFGIPHLAVGVMVARRLKAFTNQFPDAIDLIVRGLKSGLPVSESIRCVSTDFDDPVGSEFGVVVDKLKIGQALEIALWEAADRLATPEFRFFVISIAIQRETGGNLAETLENLSDLLRRRRQMQLKIRAMSSEGKASAAILGSLPFMVLAVMLAVNPHYIATLFDDPLGLQMIGGGVASLTIGMLVMAKMVRFEI